MQVAACSVTESSFQPSAIVAPVKNKLFGHFDRFTGQAICSLGANKQGASQLLAGGVLTILANLSKSQQQPTTCGSNTVRDGGGNAGAYDGLLLGTSGVYRVI